MPFVLIPHLAANRTLDLASSLLGLMAWHDGNIIPSSMEKSTLPPSSYGLLTFIDDLQAEIMYGWIDLDEFSTINIRKSTTNGAFIGEIIPKKLPSLASAKQAPRGRRSHRCWPQRKGSWPRHAGDRNAKAWQGIFRPIFSTNRFVSNIVQYGGFLKRGYCNW